MRWSANIVSFGCLGGLVLSVSILGCSAQSDRGATGGDASAGTSLTGVGDGMSADADAGDMGDMGGTDDANTTGGTKFDTLPSGSDEGGANGSCAKVDLLFVIDNSGSMADEQAKLIANFPGFASEIQSTLGGVDSYHVGVVVTDNFGLPFPDGINSDNPGCRKKGALVTSNINGTCGPFAGGTRYMTQMDDLGTAFACAANVGDQGSGYEEVAGAMIAATSPAMNAAGACNEGFIRDDALLVVVLISDENDDIESPGNPPDWYSLLSTYKFNKPDNIVVLSLVWDDSGGNPNGCVMATEEEVGSEVIAFTQMFTYGSVGSVCASSYQQFFSDAISVIDTACDEFTPPG